MNLRRASAALELLAWLLVLGTGAVCALVLAVELGLVRRIDVALSQLLVGELKPLPEPAPLTPELEAEFVRWGRAPEEGITLSVRELRTFMTWKDGILNQIPNHSTLTGDELRTAVRAVLDRLYPAPPAPPLALVPSES